MRAIDILVKKRDGKILNLEEIDYLVKGFVAGDIPDYQMSAFLMAAYFKGMNDEETFGLTRAMVESGDTVDLSRVEGVKVDKHSTGGVGDKVTLILAPMMAAVGLKVAKMAGRSLGHTGGTLDKLESIPGFKVDLTEERFINQVNEIGLAIMGQTREICPADKKIYALRDVTATVESIPLIASSVMSKKIAGGADVIVLDVKMGSGAFMKTVDEAKALAETLVSIGKRFGKKMLAVISNMDQPLGDTVGNSLEVEEAVNVMRGHGTADLLDLCFTLGAHLMVKAGKSETTQDAIQELTDVMDKGLVLAKFRQFVEAQGGDPRVADNPRATLPHARFIDEIEVTDSGYVSKINAEKIGIAAHILGAGRNKVGDEIDHTAGLLITKRIGDYVHSGDAIVQMHSNNARKFNEARALIEQSFQITNVPHEAPPIIYDIIE